MKKVLLILLILGSWQLAYPQDDVVGSGRAMRFDGIDDYIDLGNIYDNVALPITISAWIYIEPETNIITLPIFDSQDNSSLYNGFTLSVSTIPHIGFTYGDGQGGNNPVFRRAKAGYFQNLTGRWVHVAVTARSGVDMDIYLNGFNLGGEYQGSSTLPMNSDSLTEVAKIGFWFSNGNTFRFKGIMDELRIWNRSLSQQEIHETMCQKLNGNEPGLIGYWNFDETSGDVLKDLSSNHHGELKGNPTRVYSGAPVGDESVFLYTNDWVGKSLMKDDLSVVNVSGNPYGVHVYKINQTPSQTGGLNLTTVQPPYYGIFLASDDTDNEFDLSFTANTVCQSFQRTDNSESTWDESEMLSGFQERLEIIPSFEEVDLEVNLGADTILCNKQSFLLEAQNEVTGKTFLWGTGETSSSITVTSAGAFWVEVQEACKVDSDTIQVSFLNTPSSFSLGENEVSCRFESRTLSTDLVNDGFDFTWQDGSKEKTLHVVDYGLYWLKVENACGSAIDSIRFSHIELKDPFFPNFISPDNGDEDNQFFILDSQLIGSEFSLFNRWGKKVYQSLQYQNDWDGEDLPSGIYFYTIHGACLENRKGTVTIVR